jgi:hypothetical protein
MLYKSHRKALLIATVSALALGTILSLGAVYGRNRHSEPDEQTANSALIPPLSLVPQTAADGIASGR